jgi:hypothetical protein
MHHQISTIIDARIPFIESGILIFEQHRTRRKSDRAFPDREGVIAIYNLQEFALTG